MYKRQVSRLGIKRKVVVGHYTDPEVAEKLGTWARACACLLYTSSVPATPST